MSKKIVLSGMRPTGKLHLGHWVGALSNWVKLQQDYNCLFMVADWHALMSEYKDPTHMKEIVFDNVCDWLAYGINPSKSTIFIQSDVSEHLELFMFLSFITPLSWLSRCPTFKEQVKQLKDKDVNTYSFLGYPVLQASDILLYKSNCVPVGEDQLPHLELCREIARRFHFIYKKEIFIEPEALLTKTPRLMGLDGRKMSKSYDNYIALDEQDKALEKKVLSMFTDPARIKKEDKGHPDKCNVFSYYKMFLPKKKDDAYQWCSQGKKGCVECKKILIAALKEFIGSRREKKQKLIKKKKYIYDILDEGRRRAKKIAAKTVAQIKEVMGL